MSKVIRNTIKYLAVITCILCLVILDTVGAFADAEHSDVASSASMGKEKTIIKYGMVPIYGRDIEDGTYDVDVLSTSSFFKIAEAKLVVKDGKMEAFMTIASHSYLLAYPGTGEEAAAADAKDYIEFKNKGDDAVFSMEVEALNSEFDCAAYSKRKKKWYDRKLLIDASSLPQKAVKFDVPNYDKIEKAIESYEGGETNAQSGEAVNSGAKTAMDKADVMSVQMEDGEYSIAVDMTGGSGRASISSPTLMIVKDGKAYAKLIWSSTYYDYMIVGGTRYENETTDGGNSSFTVPISAMDAIIPIIADTTAMGDPVPIEYSLTFYQESIGKKSLIPQEATKRVLIVAIIIIVAGGIINYIVKKKLKV